MIYAFPSPIHLSSLLLEMLLKTGNFKGVFLNQIGGHHLRVWGLQVQDAIQLRGRNIVVMRINREKHLLWSGISFWENPFIT